MRIVIWIFNLLMLATSSQVFAVQTGYPTDAEVASLPDYCQVKLRSNPSGSEYKTWESILGHDFVHVHHFCQGLNLVNRYYRSSIDYDRKFYLRNSLTEFGYLITHAAPSFSLMPEAYMNRGGAQFKLGNSSEAMADIQKAIGLNPRLPKAYTLLAEFFMGMKRQDKALGTITEGLRNVPGSKMLQRLYIELGGKQPFPDPYEQVTNEVQSVSLETQPADSKNDAINSDDGASSIAESQSQDQQNKAEQQIGMPGNPWCRFCPDSDKKLK